MKNRILYIGLDVHKNTIDVALATGRSNGKVRSYGKIASTLDALNKLIKKLQDGDKELRFVYEAGPCGYQIYRHLHAKGISRKQFFIKAFSDFTLPDKVLLWRLNPLFEKG